MSIAFHDDTYATYGATLRNVRNTSAKQLLHRI